MKKFVLAMTVAALIAASSSATYAACASYAEQQSLGMRALQSELMVAALACGKKQHYNHYVTAFSSDLQHQGKFLQSYFQRLYGGKSEFQMNRFVTQMANQASRISLSKSNKDYCQHAEQLFTKVNALMPWQIVDLAQAHYANWHGVQSCGRKQVVAAAK